MKEVEIKIFNIKPEDVFRVYPLNTSMYEIFNGDITSTYFTGSDRMIRVNVDSDNRFCGGKNVYLTVKSLEKDSKFKTSEEINVPIKDEHEMIAALKLLGYKMDKVIKKHRISYVGFRGVKFEFDSLGDISWLEIEAKDDKTLWDTIKELGFEDRKMSKETTVEIYKRSKK